MEAVNNTQILRAVKDGPNRVSIIPTISFTMSDWINSKTNANTSPHLYTMTLEAITWDGE